MATVKLLEGGTYRFAGHTFVKGQPVEVSDKKLVASLQLSGRFHIKEGKAKDEEPKKPEEPEKAKGKKGK